MFVSLSNFAPANFEKSLKECKTASKLEGKIKEFCALHDRVAISAGKQEKTGKSWKKTLFSKSAGKAGIYIHFLQPVLEKLEKCPFSSG